MRKDLLSWQWRLYGPGHRDRLNLALHVLTVPLFWAGTLALASGVVLGWACSVGGAAGMAVALVAQGRGHRREQARPVPFEGPGDFVSRFFAEQLVTFPRYLLSGGWARAWRNK